MKIPEIDIVFTDLDRTLLDSDNKCSNQNYSALKKLGENEKIRVIATGRSLYSIHKVLPIDFPVDYIIFSSGAGIIDWNRKKIIQNNSLDQENVISIGQKLREMDIDFMVHYPIPENHHFVYYSTGKSNPDFFRRIEIYREFSESLNFSLQTFGRACQILAVIPDDQELFSTIKNKFTDIKVIRATSPIDHKSIWVEMFPKNVSKGFGADWLCKKLNINRQNSISIGNDYNDIDLLEYTAHSYLVDNAPPILKEKYPVCPDNNSNGFSELMLKVGILE